MRKMKKLVSMMMALVMVMAMSVTAFAADDTYTITINNSTEGYEYTAYQIFVGDLSEGVLSNIEFGDALGDEKQADVLENYASVLSGDYDEDGEADYESSAAGLAEALADGKITAAEFAAYIADIFTLIAAGSTTVEEVSTYDADAGTYTISVTGAGYYLIENTVIPEKDGAYTSYILQVVGDVEVNAKSDIPSLDKTVDDINDSADTSATTSENDSADYDIGDAISFTLTATLPTNYGDYETYQLIFHDTMSDGLTFNSDSAKVTIDGTEINSSFYTVDSVTSEEDGTTSVTITFSDLTETVAVASSTVVVSYTATLNDKASYMEENDAYLEYSNNPNEKDGGTTGETPDDKTTVFTFELTVNKIDEENNALNGAGFTLYKYDADTKEYVAVGSEITGDDLSSFTWSGLDDGQYKLSETTTPAGYNTMEDVEFYIVAEHTEGELTSLKVVDADGNEIEGYTEVLSDGTITTDIMNYSGSTLPSTGGMGTTIFYVVGSILVIGAAVLLITRRRMGNAE
ncbi:MAG: SpaH/EbpB family LPXTG-anchored major pilin [Lachnospiraceae bacterium]|nr:SpaH/EbpB family LPXTG-anchored major pilin [Lachnospiraceae bacterium]